MPGKGQCFCSCVAGAVAGNGAGVEEALVGEARKRKTWTQTEANKVFGERGIGESFLKSSVVICESHLDRSLHRYTLMGTNT